MTEIPALARTHAKIAKAFEGSGAMIESLPAVEAVFRHRMFWKPETVKVVLLAESHVLTKAEELSCTVDLSAFGVRAPTQYARFVYCLGYGESEFVDGQIDENSGTPQFWKLFSAFLHGPDEDRFCRVLKGGTPDARARVSNKLALLSEMKRRGIWLVDASGGGLYVPAGSKTGYKDTQRAIEESWISFWHAQLRAEQPRYAICIGVGVYETLKHWLRDMFPDGVSKIEQPNARLSAEKHRQNMAMCAEACSRFAPA